MLCFHMEHWSVGNPITKPTLYQLSQPSPPQPLPSIHTSSLFCTSYVLVEEPSGKRSLAGCLRSSMYCQSANYDYGICFSRGDSRMGDSIADPFKKWKKRFNRGLCCGNCWAIDSLSHICAVITLKSMKYKGCDNLFRISRVEYGIHEYKFASPSSNLLK